MNFKAGILRPGMRTSVLRFTLKGKTGALQNALAFFAACMKCHR